MNADLAAMLNIYRVSLKARDEATAKLGQAERDAVTFRGEATKHADMVKALAALIARMPDGNAEMSKVNLEVIQQRKADKGASSPPLARPAESMEHADAQLIPSKTLRHPPGEAPPTAKKA